MKYILITIVLVIASIMSFGQSNEPNLCDLLKLALNNDQFIGGLELDTTNANAMAIMDVDGVLGNCGYLRFQTKHNIFDIVDSTRTIVAPSYFCEIVHDSIANYFNVIIIDHSKNIVQIAKIKRINGKWVVVDIDGGKM